MYVFGTEGDVENHLMDTTAHAGRSNSTQGKNTIFTKAATR